MKKQKYIDKILNNSPSPELLGQFQTNLVQLLASLREGVWRGVFFSNKVTFNSQKGDTVFFSHDQGYGIIIASGKCVYWL